MARVYINARRGGITYSEFRLVRIRGALDRCIEMPA